MRFPSFFVRWVVGFGLLGWSACAAVPLGTPRDASILKPGERRDDVLITSMTPLATLKGKPSIFGGNSLEWSRRAGKEGGRESAFKIGANSFFQGVYGGLETAKDLRKGTRDWGTVGYAGVIGGIDSFAGSIVPAHPYLNGYAGLIAGKVTGNVRTELNIRLSLQSGAVSYDPYGLGILTLEPRVRMAGQRFQFMMGLGLDAGYIFCDRCISAQQDQSASGTLVLGIHPTFGVSLP